MSRTPDRLISAPRGIVIAADVNPQRFDPLIRHTIDVPGIVGYKTGPDLALSHLGLAGASRLIRAYDAHRNVGQSDAAKIIYDHHDAITGDNERGYRFAQLLKQADVDAAVITLGPNANSQKYWIEALQDQGIVPIVHVPRGDLQSFTNAAEFGASEFYNPIKRNSYTDDHKRQLDLALGDGNYTLYAATHLDTAGAVVTPVSLPVRFHSVIGPEITGSTNVSSTAEIAVASIR